VSAVLLLIGAAVGYTWPQSTASPNSETGTVVTVTADPASSATHFTFKPKGSDSTQSLVYFPSTPWQATSQATWSSTGDPPCLVTGDHDITIGVITADNVGSAPGGPMVVWVECYR
jgi:hypothetical protein